MDSPVYHSTVCCLCMAFIILDPLSVTAIRRLIHQFLTVSVTKWFCQQALSRCEDGEWNASLAGHAEAGWWLDLDAAPASQAYLDRVFSVCWDLCARKRNRTSANLEQRTFHRMNKNYLAWMDAWQRMRHENHHKLLSKLLHKFLHCYE